MAWHRGHAARPPSSQKRGRGRHPETRRLEPQTRSITERRRYVYAGTEPPPTCTFEMPPLETGAPGVDDRKRSPRQLRRNECGSSHNPSIRLACRQIQPTRLRALLEHRLVGGDRLLRRLAPAEGLGALEAGPPPALRLADHVRRGASQRFGLPIIHH